MKPIVAKARCMSWETRRDRGDRAPQWVEVELAVEGFFDSDNPEANKLNEGTFRFFGSMDWTRLPYDAKIKVTIEVEEP